MKTKFKLGFALLLMAFVIVACQCTEKPQASDPERALLRLGTEYPPLLSSENAHNVTIKLRSVPTNLNTNDIAEIISLVGRIPGLRNYEVRVMRYSVLYPGLVDVFVPPVFIMINKEEQHWRVYKIEGYSY
jgi:hypothetical protein